nr:hypothetical protein [Corynebacterium alimapuense]
MSPTPSARAGEIGLKITGATDAGNITIIDATAVAVSNACTECSRRGELRDYVTRQLVDLPVVGFPTRLHVSVRASPARTPSATGRSSRPHSDAPMMARS